MRLPERREPSVNSWIHQVNLVHDPLADVRRNGSQLLRRLSFEHLNEVSRHRGQSHRDQGTFNGLAGQMPRSSSSDAHAEQIGLPAPKVIGEIPFSVM